MTSAIRPIPRDPYPIKIEMSEDSAEQIRNAIYTVRNLFPNSELSEALYDLGLAINRLGVTGIRTLSIVREDKVIRPI